MLSEEEKKAIERLIIYKDKIKDELYPIIDFEEEKAIGIVLNLIEKQSKEIEELKITNKELTERVLRLESDKFWNNVVSKDKIKTFIKEELPDDEICSCCEIFDINGIDLKRKLQSLLEKE